MGCVSCRYYNRLMFVRPAAPLDLPSIQSIYAYHVLHGLASFEEQAPPLEEMRRRFEEGTGRGLPYLAAEENGEVLAPPLRFFLFCLKIYLPYLISLLMFFSPRQGKGIG